ncbi:MAG: wax ester/triacylglycerol synthase family O-acyltransferase [Henriciella sp.]|nr:wax ester/triacylglycerol synthase family O-acyltransferase [Henriciella sp.]
MDASFVAMETPSSPMHIGSILIYDPSTAPGGFVRFKDILRFYEERMRFSKTMRQKLVKVPFNVDYPYWVEDADFDLEYHVRHVALPKPGDWRQLNIQAARLFARPLDLSRPPWEMTVVEGLDNVPGVPKGSYAIVSKVHHAAIDGMSGIDLMQALHTPTPDVTSPNEPDNWKPEKYPNRVGMFAKGYARAWINPIRQMGVSAQAIPGLYRAARGMIKGEFGLKAAIEAPKTRFNTKISPHRVVDGQVFELAHIKALRALADGAKVNDVMLTIIGGGLNKYLTHHNDLPKTTMTAMAPISVRTEGEKNTMGNQVSTMIAPLGTHIADPVERMAYVFDQTSRSKEMTSALGARQMTEASKVSPALFMALGAQLYSRLGVANYMVRPVINTVVTNVPGPPVPIYQAGAKLVSMQGLLCLLDGMALGHVVQSYVKEATITFTADRNVMPDPEFYSQCLRESFEEMADAAGLDLSPPKSTPAPKKAVNSRKSRTSTKRKSTSATTKRATTGKSKAKAS